MIHADHATAIFQYNLARLDEKFIKLDKNAKTQPDNEQSLRNFLLTSHHDLDFIRKLFRMKNPLLNCNLEPQLCNLISEFSHMRAFLMNGIVEWKRLED